MDEEFNRLYEEIFKRLKSKYNEEAVKGMERFGINVKNTYGVPIPELRNIAKEIGRNHPLAQSLWSSGVHEAKLLATMIEDPEMVTEEQMEQWVKDTDSWDICDACCGNLFDKTPFAYRKAVEWSSRKEEYVKRAGFVLMAELVVHDKKASDEKFLEFLPLIKKQSTDERNFVRKAVNWALRQIGKRNSNLNEACVKTAKEMKKINSKSAKWIASDALIELTSESVKLRLHQTKSV
ncbi:MAG: DNA alkylation repair protein [Nitrososphaeria archaeon]|jgi:3-methyladenine DNA glycosylase AlkD